MNTVRIDPLRRFGIIMGLLAVCALTARAQEGGMPEATGKQVPVWVKHIGEQLGQALESPAKETRLDALQHIAYFAYFYGEALDLRATLPRLLAIYEKDEDEQCRLLALAGIHAISDERTMQQVRRLASGALQDESSRRVQLVTLAALMQYYGEDTFQGDEETAKLARSLFEYYTSPRVLVEPPVVIGIDRQ